MIRTIGLVTTNYNLNGYGVLTEERPASAVPFGGRYRLLDFALSNMVNSRIQTVGLVTPYRYRSIMDHVGSGKPWGLDKKSGGLYILPGSVYGLRDTESRFLFRDILHNLSYFRQGDADYVLVSSGSLVANVDYTPMLAQQEVRGSQVTLLYRRTAEGEKRKAYYLTLNGEGRVTGIDTAEEGEYQFLDSFLIEKSLLLRLAEDFSTLGYMNFIDVLKMVLDSVNVDSFRFDGHVAYMDNVKDYFRSSMALLEPAVRQDLFSRERPILTKIHDTPPALYTPGSSVTHTVMAAGTVVEGEVENSVVFRSCRIEKGAVVKNCVLMEKCVIKAGARLENVICDKYVTVSEGAVICGTDENPCVLPKGCVV